MDSPSPPLSDALPRRVYKPPLGISADQNDVEEENHHRHHDFPQNHRRRLGLADRDPTGFLVRFQGCSVEDDSKVVLEVCPTYHRGGFGGACRPYLTDYFEWVKFHHNTIILRMLHDFCTVCDDVCPPDVYREATSNTPNTGNSFPDICNSVYVYSLIQIDQDYKQEEESCDLICDAHHEKHTAVLERCTDNRWGDHKSCSTDPNYRRRWLDEDVVETCALDEWWMEWTNSCDMPGYPTMADELTNTRGNAFLQCSFEDSESDDPAHCRDFYYKQITSCQGFEKNWHWDTPPPTSVDCQTHPSSISSPTRRPTDAPKIYSVESVVIEKEENTMVPISSSSSSTGGTNTVGFGFLMFFAFFLALSIWIKKLHQRQYSPQWDSIPQTNLQLREVQDEPHYHPVIEMNSKN